MTCIITGCRLVIQEEGKSLWGDLHQLHDGTFIFSGNLFWSDSGRSLVPAWEYAYYGDARERQLLITSPYFEKRGVVTIPATSGEYNAAAKEYLK